MSKPLRQRLSDHAPRLARQPGSGTRRPSRSCSRSRTDWCSLREALTNLDKDRDFLKAGGVFDDDFIDTYIELKMTEVIRFEHTPHPVEYVMYYSA